MKERVERKWGCDEEKKNPWKGGNKKEGKVERGGRTDVLQFT